MAASTDQFKCRLDQDTAGREIGRSQSRQQSADLLRQQLVNDG
jgi:hypothetical protein